MVYVLCLQHIKSISYFEILGIYLNKNMAKEAMDKFNERRKQKSKAIVRAIKVIKTTQIKQEEAA